MVSALEKLQVSVSLINAMCKESLDETGLLKTHDSFYVCFNLSRWLTHMDQVMQMYEKLCEHHEVQPTPELFKLVGKYAMKLMEQRKAAVVSMCAASVDDRRRKRLELLKLNQASWRSAHQQLYKA